MKKFIVFISLIFTGLLFMPACDGGGSSKNPGDGSYTDNRSYIKATTGSIEINWITPDDDDFNHFEIECSDSDGSVSSNLNIDEMAPYRVTDLENSTKYSITITEVYTVAPEKKYDLTVFTTDTGKKIYHFIFTVKDLNAVRGGVDDYDGWGMQGNYILMADLDLDIEPYNSGTGWNPLGTDSVPGDYTFDGTPYSGIFIGNNHVIRNLYINKTDVDYIGLFGSISGAGIYDLGLESADVAGLDYTGSLVGYSTNSTVDGCYSDAAVNGYGSHAGGLSGYNKTTAMSDCHTTGTVTMKGSNGNTGGLVGYTDSSPMTGCYSSATVTGNFNTGGLAGVNYSSPMTGCYASGNVTGTGQTGGLAGQNGGSAMTGCHYTGSAVTATGTFAGGLVGYNSYSSLNSCYVITTVNGSATNNGGLVGYNYASAITACYAFGAVSGISETGGLVGFNHWDSTITDCYATGSVSGSSCVGGLVGYNQYGVLITSYAACAVTATGERGGLVGKYDNLHPGSYTNCYYDSTVSGQVDTGRGEPRTTTQMQDNSTYTGWNFDNVWAIDGDYPYLQVFNE